MLSPNLALFDPDFCVIAVVLFNFRADRMVEMSKAFEYEEFKYV